MFFQKKRTVTSIKYLVYSFRRSRIFPVNRLVVIKYTAALLLIFFSCNLLAQKTKKQEARLLSDRAEWFEGSIMLTNGNELKGLIKYNDRNGVLSYQDDTEFRVFTPLRVAAFEFFDESKQKQRIFYTLTYEDYETNVDRPFFFEVLKEYKSFAILSKSDRLDIDQKNTSTSFSGFSSSAGIADPYAPREVRLVISQTETIYIMKSTGEISPYFKVINTDDGTKSLILAGRDTKTKNKMIDPELLEEFIAPSDYEKLWQYADTNNLSFKKKEDFLKILDFYDEISRH